VTQNAPPYFTNFLAFFNSQTGALKKNSSDIFMNVD